MKSMTGFGRGQFTADGVDILAEIRSVNHRFLECTVRLPRAYSFLEEPIKKAVQQVAARGKIEVNLTMQLPESATNTVAVNVELANAYCQALQAANETLQLQSVRYRNSRCRKKKSGAIPKSLWNRHYSGL